MNILIISRNYLRNNCLINWRYASTKIQELAAGYVPKEIENFELRDDYFKPPLKENGGRFSMILPPPNITGTLHLGHALTTTIQDVLVKWKRLNGIETVWVPGMDHAGIATQVVVEKKLWNTQRKTRHDIGRDEFINQVWEWKREKASIISEQLHRLGVSLDWNREIFTLDPIQSEYVTQTFLKLHQDGLIYESDYLINWSCALRSAISDIEVEYLNVEGAQEINVPGYQESVRFGILTQFAYKLVDSDDEIVVATTRPETVLGDVAVAVNPADNRFSNYIGKQVWHPLRSEAIPIISDEFVDPQFGTGAVKITPSHDQKDFEVGRKHKLDFVCVIGDDGRIKAGGKFDGLQRFEARKEIVKVLKEMGLFRKEEEHAMAIPICSRSKDVIEFLVKPQWFMRCDQMAKLAANSVREKRLVIEPEGFEKIWFNWLDNIKDWCISRQLWWGHRIPIYRCWSEIDPNKIIKIPAGSLNEAKEKAKKQFGDENVIVEQVEDVLDTWFSSALLPMSSFNNVDRERLHPLSLMETGHDILFFWVARMVMLGTYLSHKLPFDRVFLHGIICDVSGRKMSKSLGNVISPEDVIRGRTLQELREISKMSGLSEDELARSMEGQRKMFPEGIPECGVDALRFTLCSHNVKGHFINFDVQQCKVNKFFGNKIWQATKFTAKWCQNVSQVQTLQADLDFQKFGHLDKWILSRLDLMVEEVTTTLNNHDFHFATAALKQFLYFDFCDIYLETTKIGFKEPQSLQAAQHCWTLIKCLSVSLKCLSPFMPFLSQHLYQQLYIHPISQNFDQYYPQVQNFRNEKLEKEVDTIMNVVVAIRRLRKIFGVSGKYNPKVVLITRGDSPLYKIHIDWMTSLSGCSSVILSNEDVEGVGYVTDVIADGPVIRLYVPEELRNALEVDSGKYERKREKLLKDLEKMRRVVGADGYKGKVTQEVHEANLKKISILEEKITRIDYVRSFSKSGRLT